MSKEIFPIIINNNNLFYEDGGEKKQITYISFSVFNEVFEGV